MKKGNLFRLFAAVVVLGNAWLVAQQEGWKQARVEASQEAAKKQAKVEPKKEVELTVESPKTETHKSVKETQEELKKSVKGGEVKDTVVSLNAKKSELEEEIKKLKKQKSPDVEDMIKMKTEQLKAIEENIRDMVQKDVPGSGRVFVSKLEGYGAAKATPLRTEEIRKTDQNMKSVKANTTSGKGYLTLGVMLLGLLGTGGIGGVLGGVLGDKKDDEDQTDPFAPNAVAMPDAIETLNPYAEPGQDNESYQKNLYLIASAFSKIEESFTSSIENGDYYNPKFRISLGQITLDKQVDVAIEYNFGEGGAGNVGTSLTPIEINILPNEINGYAVTIDKLLAQIKPENQEMATVLLRPNAALIFAIKIILLNKTVQKDPTFKDNFERIREMITESALLYSRLILVAGNADVSTQAIISGLPLPIQEYLGKTTTKMYSENVKALQSGPQQNSSVVVDTILSLRADVPEYKDRTNAMNETVLPLVQQGLSFFEQKFIVHAFVRHAADLGVNVTKATNAKTELLARLNVLIPLLNSALQAMTNAEFDPTDTVVIQKALTVLNEIKVGKKPLSQNIAAPCLGDPKSGVQDIALTMALDIYSRNFLALQSKKFKGDYGYKPCDLLLGKSETVDVMLAILLRGVSDVVNAEKILLKSTEPAVELSKVSGTFTINPSEEFSKLIKKPSDDVDKAREALLKAMTQLKNAPTNPDNKTAYDTTKKVFDDSVLAVANAMQKYRNSFPPYYPIKTSDGTSRTVAAYVKDALQTIKKLGHKDSVASFPEIYSRFQKALGLPIGDIWDITTVK